LSSDNDFRHLAVNGPAAEAMDNRSVELVKEFPDHHSRQDEQDEQDDIAAKFILSILLILSEFLRGQTMPDENNLPTWKELRNGPDLSFSGPATVRMYI
jgi:hypothetical protein